MLFHERNWRIHQTYRARGDKQFRAAFPAKFTFKSVSRSAVLTMNHNDSFLFCGTAQVLFNRSTPTTEGIATKRHKNSRKADSMSFRSPLLLCLFVAISLNTYKIPFRTFY